MTCNRLWEGDPRGPLSPHCAQLLQVKPAEPAEGSLKPKMTKAQATPSGYLYTGRAPIQQELQFPLTNFSQTMRRNAAGPLSSDCPQLLQSEPAELKYIETKPQTTLVANSTLHSPGPHGRAR